MNEGGFGSLNASVSFLDNDGQVYSSIYKGVSSKDLGDVAQSMSFNGNNAYILVNNSSTVEVVDRNTFEPIATVTDKIVNPRYIGFSANKGYITNWGDPNNPNDDYVAVLNLDTNLVEAKISVVEGPEKLLISNGKIYIAHQGGYRYGNTISVIDIATANVTANIQVADVPSGMVIDSGSLYIMCSGKASFTQDETLAKIFKINLSDLSIETVLTFPQGEHPSSLEFENNALYFTNRSSVFTIDTNDFKLPQNALFDASADGVQILYGFDVNDNKIYIADAKDYVSNGEAFIYGINGQLQQRFRVQIIPNSFYFQNN